MFNGKKKFVNLTEMRFSSKMKMLIGQLKEMKEGDKAIIYSQFTSFLNILGFALANENMAYERLDGTMAQNKRASSIENFKTSKNVNIFLISLKAGGVGNTFFEY